MAHAIAQFRGRIATEHDKRSAVLTLVGILEERRELIATRVGRKDEGRCSPSPTIWLDAAAASSGPVLRKISRGNRALPRPLHPESVNDLVQAAVARAGLRGGPYSAHSLRAGFETYAHLHGTSDRAIAHQTRHRSLATLGMYVRIHEAWKDNAATMLGL